VESYHYIANLIIKQLQGTLEQEEAIFLQQWIEEDISNKNIYNKLTDIEQLGCIVQTSYHVKERVEERIKKTIGDSSFRPPARFNRKYWLAAASFIIVLGLGGLLLLRDNNHRRKNNEEETRQIADINAPLSSKPVLKMANGQFISLDTLNGELLNLGDNVQLVKGANGELIYQTTSGQRIQALQNNTLINPRGSTVLPVTLSDGTKIWLNAGSSISYPVIFTGNERRVTIEGEAYFEVAHHAAKPFIVSKNKLDIKVLGTKFNVHAYDNDDDIYTVLLEGSVKIANSAQSVILTPGQQAISPANSNGKPKVSKADIDKAMTWRTDFFRFDLFSFPEIIKQLERWYDIDITVLNADIEHINLSGDMNRSTSLFSVIKILEYSGLNCQLLPNRKLTISKK
jgi:transmembrane sensor